MPLQNRVTPFGEFIADSARGLLMGNRGGRLHDSARRLTARCWASRQWICCVLAFKDRHRTIWGDSYTELFFLDEVTALAAGHRPCFECRRADANALAEAWARASGRRPAAAEMDAVLHGERLNGKRKRLHRMQIDDLPDGAVIERDGAAFAIRGRELLLWSASKYAKRLPRPEGIVAHVLTPPAILSALCGSYRPHWHPSADPDQAGA